MDNSFNELIEDIRKRYTDDRSAYLEALNNALDNYLRDMQIELLRENITEDEFDEREDQLIDQVVTEQLNTVKTKFEQPELKRVNRLNILTHILQPRHKRQTL